MYYFDADVIVVDPGLGWTPSDGKLIQIIGDEPPIMAHIMFEGKIRKGIFTNFED